MSEPSYRNPRQPIPLIGMESIQDHAYDAMLKIMGHIDLMYPDMWSVVSIAARQSMSHTIAQVVTQTLLDAMEEERWHREKEADEDTGAKS